jgi:hypothetical protein
VLLPLQTLSLRPRVLRPSPWASLVVSSHHYFISSAIVMSSFLGPSTYLYQITAGLVGSLCL